MEKLEEVQKTWLHRPFMAQIRHPLHLALASTPLVLLLQTQIDNRPLRRELLLEVRLLSIRPFSSIKVLKIRVSFGRACRAAKVQDS
jgi:hypothetical protein